MTLINLTTSVNLQLSENGVAQISLPDTIQSEEALKTVFLSFASHVISRNIKKVMVHNHELNHHISNNFQEWAHKSLELPLLQNGVEKIAIVHPKNPNILSLISKVDNVRKKYFENEADALVWLNS